MVKTALSVDAFSALSVDAFSASAIAMHVAMAPSSLMCDDVASEVKWVVTTQLKTPNRQLPN